MLELSQEEHDEMTAALDALALQLAARVPLSWDVTGIVLVPLHPLLGTVALAPLLESTALTLLHPQSCTRAHGRRPSWSPWGKLWACWPCVGTFPARWPRSCGEQPTSRGHTRSVPPRACSAWVPCCDARDEQQLNGVRRAE
jgi:hypothetical protein